MQHDRGRTRGGWARWGALGLALCLFPGGAWGQAAPSATDEATRLRQALEQAREEIRVLREENARLRSGAGAPVAVVPPAASPVVTTAPMAGVAPGQVVLPVAIEDGASVSVEQLLADYRQSTLAGDARYKGRRFRLEGTVRGFKRTFGGLTWLVELQSKGQLGLVRCSVSVPGMSDFRPAQGGRVLEARRPFKAWQTILTVGESFVLEGMGAGVDDAVVVMKDCHPVPNVSGQAKER